MKIAIIGATGEVGRMVLTCLSEFNITCTKLDLFASNNSAGKTILYDNNEIKVKSLSKNNLNTDYDYVFLTAGGNISKEYAKIIVDNGAIAIDNSSVFRQEDTIPLIVPEVNGHLLKNYKGIIANPNCSTIQLMLVLNPLQKYKKINKVVVTTMQSVSGAGNKGIVELEAQRNNCKNINVFPKPIDLNVIPQIGDFDENDNSQFKDYCYEEIKMTLEARKILNIPDFDLVATTVRVPVIYGHSESVYIEFNENVDINHIINILSNERAVIYNDNYLTPVEINESNCSHVARIRYAGNKKSILLWNLANNIRLGAATNAVKIMIEHHNPPPL